MADVNLDLDVDCPEKVARVLRAAAEKFFEAHSELQSAWQDKSAGAAWAKIARILERAAASCEKVDG